MRTNHLDIKPMAGAVGAEIDGVNLGGAMSADTVDDIRRVLAERGVVVFRDQTLTPEQHIAVAHRFGGIDVNRFFAHAEGYPEIALVVKEPEQTQNIGGGWHTDHSYDQVPALGSMLYAREVPPTGGDTMFASMYAAYDALSDGLKRTLSGLRAVHSSRHVFGADRWRAPHVVQEIRWHRAERRTRARHLGVARDARRQRAKIDQRVLQRRRRRRA